MNSSSDNVVCRWQPERLTLHGKVRVLAPMVRLGTLPLRVMALRHGADAVFSEEIIDRKLASCCRIQDDRLNTIDFIPAKSDKEASEPGRGGIRTPASPTYSHTIHTALPVQPSS